MTSAARAVVHRAAQSDFIRQVAATFATRIGLIGAGVISSVLIARSLGPDGRGVMAIAAAVTAIAIQFGNLGLHASNTWAVAKDRSLLPTLIANSVAASLAVGAALIAIVIGVVLVAPHLIELDAPILAVALIGIPVGLTTLLLQNLLIGLQRIRDYNVLEIAARGLAILVTLALIVGRVVSPIAFLLGGTAVSIGILIATLYRLRLLAGQLGRPRWALLQEYSSFGLRAYSAALASYLVIRIDLFLVQGYLGFGAAGQYSVAVALADLVYSLPVVIGTLLFPRLAAMTSDTERVSYAAAVAKRVAALIAHACVAATLFADFGVTLLYGNEFRPAVPAFVWLLPGIAALSVHTVYMNYFAAVGLPTIALLAPTVGLVANLFLNVTLLPTTGLVGASVASTLAYAFMLGISGCLFLRRRRQVTPPVEGLAIRG